MLRRSAKNKGKRLEKFVRDTLLVAFPALTADDVRITVGAETGADIKLSAKAKAQIPLKIECKYREIFKTIYGFYAQACGDTSVEPVLIIKMNNCIPLAIVDYEYFLRLLKDRKNV